MKANKIMAGVLSASILIFSAGSVFGADIEGVRPIKDVDGMKETTHITDAIKHGHFGSFTGKVNEIKDFHGVEGSQFVSVEGEEGRIANIIIHKDTYILDNAEIEVGSIITGFYDVNAPMLMIYPPQYNTEVVVVEQQGENIENIKVDLFDENLVSADQSLKLNPSNDTEIVLKDGRPFEGDLKNKKLVVIYDISTKSIPAQTNPTKIIVLSEEEVQQEQEEVKQETGMDINDVSSMDIIVDNSKIQAPKAFASHEGTVMVPLRPIAEALGFDVTWEDETQRVRIGKGIFLTIGEDNYIYMKAMPIQLGKAPTLVEGRTFVPLNFFRDVMHINNAYVLEGQIVIDNGEKME